MKKIIKIEDLEQLEDLLKGKTINTENYSIFPLTYLEEDDKKYIIFERNIVKYNKVPELADYRFLYAIKLLEAIHNTYIAIFDNYGNLLFDYNEFLEYRKKLSGIKEYSSDNLILSSNLYFEGLDDYLKMIDINFKQIKERREKIIEEIVRIFSEENISVTIGNNSGGDIELVEAGSTARGTNIPTLNGKGLDFDFTVRVDQDKVFIIKRILEEKLKAQNSITKTSRYKVRLVAVEIPGLEELIDLDFSLTPQKEKYLSTEDAINEQLENIRMQDENSYKLVLANIMFAKAYLKKCGAYKPSRGILEGDRAYGGIGGIGIENWILQNGGSFIDAARSFLSKAEGMEFIDFQKKYAIMDFGKNHVEVSKGHFPYDNFIMKNMRYKGYELMKEALKIFLEEFTITKEGPVR